MAVEFVRKDRYTAEDLVRIVELLRGPDGCPWDREQTHASIRGNMLEEAYEAADAIDAGDPAQLREELGDVLLQVALHARMEEEAGSFAFDDVCTDICNKLIIRHPHVFAEISVSGTDEVLSNWEMIKNHQKGQNTFTQTLQSVPRAFPALMRSQKVQKRAAKSGMDFATTEDAVHSLRSELDELSGAIAQADPARCADELGDLLFSAVNVSRFLSLDAEECLARACDRFIGRFAQVERLAGERGIEMTEAAPKTLDELWAEAKRTENT